MNQKTAHKTDGFCPCPKPAAKPRDLCLSCGTKPLPKRRRRYCSDKCRKRLEFALFIATGLVQTLRARYAAFSYTDDALILDVLPSAAKAISRFVWPRSTNGNGNGSANKTVADDLLEMVERAGREWHATEGETRSRWWASQHLLDRACRKDLPVSRIVPVRKKTPQFNHKEKSALRLLELTKEQILSAAGCRCIKSAYRRMAKLHHPDKGDQTNKFVEINEAHARLLNWAQRPRFLSRTALPNSWCYDASKGRWLPPV